MTESPPSDTPRCCWWEGKGGLWYASRSVFFKMNIWTETLATICLACWCRQALQWQSVVPRIKNTIPGYITVVHVWFYLLCVGSHQQFPAMSQGELRMYCTMEMKLKLDCKNRELLSGKRAACVKLFGVCDSFMNERNLAPNFSIFNPAHHGWLIPEILWW